MVPINSFNNSSVVSIQGEENRLLMRILLLVACVVGVILTVCWLFKSKELKQFSNDFSRRMKAFANPPSDTKADKGSNKI
jgi:hypothetical protein